MSEAPEAESEELDLTGVPMDGDDPATADAGAEGEDGKKPEGEEKAPLAADELEKRHANTKIALATERAKRRELERRLDALERGGGDRDEPRRQAARPVAEEETEIDPDVDPVAALKQLRAKVSAYEQAEKLETQTETQRQTREAQYNRVERALAEHETDFREDHADYDDAAKHYAVARAQELMQFGLQPAQVQPMLREEFAQLAATAIAANKNPASVVYQLAKGRGFGGPKLEAKEEPKTGKGAEKIDALVRGRAAGSPLGGSGGRPSSGLDAATVANINIRDPKGGEAFDKAFEALERKAKRAERGM